MTFLFLLSLYANPNTVMKPQVILCEVWTACETLEFDKKTCRVIEPKPKDHCERNRTPLR